MKNFVCVCGRKFTDPQRFNGHKSHCKEHQIKKYGTLDIYLKRQNRCIKNRQDGYRAYADNNKNNKALIDNDNLNLWISEKHACERCGKVMETYYGSGRFCCKSCANKRDYSEETKFKIGKSVKGQNRRKKNEEEYYKNPNTCKVCGNVLSYEKRNRKTCCKDCYAVYDREIQKRFSPVQRSKNEIDFCNMCIDFFGSDNVVNNEKMFNGWDADVILPQYKIAVLWNGPWHYEKITKNQKFEQIKNRDRIKLCEIQKCGYVPYIIKDMGQADYAKVVREFGMFLDWIIDTHTV